MQEAEKKKLQEQSLEVANQGTMEQPAEEPHKPTEVNLEESLRELLCLFANRGWPDTTVDKMLEAVIRRCGRQPVDFPDMPYADRLRENAKILVTVLMEEDPEVEALLDNQTVEIFIQQIIRLIKSEIL